MGFEDVENFIMEQNTKLAETGQFLCANMSNAYNHMVVLVKKTMNLNMHVVSAHSYFKIARVIEDCNFPTFDIPTSKIPTSDIPTSDIPASKVPTSDVPSSAITTPDVPTFNGIDYTYMGPIIVLGITTLGQIIVICILACRPPPPPRPI